MSSLPADDEDEDCAPVPVTMDDEALRAYLQPFDFSADIDRECAAFVPGTRTALIADFDAWAGRIDPEPAAASGSASASAAAEPSRVWQLQDAPGYGKTCLMSLISRRFADDVVAAHFCSFKSPTRNEPARIVQSLAWHIAQRIPQYKAELMRILPSVQLAQSQSPMSLPPLELWRMLVADPLKAVGPAVTALRPTRKYVLLLDGLDEVSNHPTLSSPFESLFGPYAALLPAWMGVAQSAGKAGAFGSQPHVAQSTEEDDLSDVLTFLRHHLDPKGGTKVNLTGESDPSQVGPALESLILRLAPKCFSLWSARIMLAHFQVLPPIAAAPSAPWCPRDFEAHPLSPDELNQGGCFTADSCFAVFFPAAMDNLIPSGDRSCNEELPAEYIVLLCVRTMVTLALEPLSLQTIAEILTVYATIPSLTSTWRLTENHAYTIEEVAAIFAPVHPIYVLSDPQPTATTTVSLLHYSLKDTERQRKVGKGILDAVDIIRACWAKLTGVAYDGEDPPIEQLTGTPPPLMPHIVQQAEALFRAGRTVSASAPPPSGLSAYAIRWIGAHAMVGATGYPSTMLAHPQLHYVRCLLDADAPRQIREELSIQRNDPPRGTCILSWAPANGTFLALYLFHQLLTPQRQQQLSKEPRSMHALQLTVLTNSAIITERRAAVDQRPACSVLHLGTGIDAPEPQVHAALQSEQTDDSFIESVSAIYLPTHANRPIVVSRIVDLLRQPKSRVRLIDLSHSQATDVVLSWLFDAITAIAEPTRTLRHLILTDNVLRNLPQDFQMRGWQGLLELDLSENRTLLSPASALVNTSAKALRYLADLTSETPQRVSKLRLMVTGFGGVGKSTFIAAFSRALPARMAAAEARDNTAAASVSAAAASSSVPSPSGSASASVVPSSPASPLHGFLSSLERNSAAAIREWTPDEVVRWARIRELPLACIAALAAQSVNGQRLCGWADDANQADRLAFAESCIGAESAEEKQQSADDEQKQQSPQPSSAGEPTSPAGRAGALSPHKDHSGAYLSWSAVRSSRVSALSRLLLSESATLVHSTGYCSTSAPVQSSLGDFEVVDFSGQIEYYVSHSLFLSGQHAIFVCVAPAAKQFGSMGMEVEDEAGGGVKAASADPAADSSATSPPAAASSSAAVQLLVDDAVSASALSSPDSVRRRDQWLFWLRFLSTLSAEGARTPVHLAVSRCDFMPRTAVQRKLRPLVQAQRDELSAVHAAAANPRLELHSTVHTLDYRDAWIDADINAVCDAVLATAKRMFQDSLIPFVYHKLEVRLREEIKRRKAGSGSEDISRKKEPSAISGKSESDSGAWATGLPIMTEKELADFAISVDSRYSTDPALLQRCCDHLRGVALLLFIPTLRIYVLEPIRWLAAVLALFIRDGREDDRQIESDQIEFDRSMTAAVAAAPSSSSEAAPSDSPPPPSFLTPYHIVKHQLEGSGLAIGEAQCRQAASILVALDVAHHDAATDHFLFPTQLPPVSKTILVQKMFHQIHRQQKLQRPAEVDEKQWTSFFSPAGSVSRLQSLLEHRRLQTHYVLTAGDRDSLNNSARYPPLDEPFDSVELKFFSGLRLTYADAMSFLPLGLFVQLQLRLIHMEFAFAVVQRRLEVGYTPQVRSLHPTQPLEVASYEMRRGCIVLHLCTKDTIDKRGALMVRLDPRAQAIDIHYVAMSRTDGSPIEQVRQAILELGSSYSGFNAAALEATWLCPMCIAACRINCCQFKEPANTDMPVTTKSSITRRLMWPHEATPKRMRELAEMEKQEQQERVSSNTVLPQFTCCADETAPTMRWIDLILGTPWMIVPVTPGLGVPTSTDVTRPAFGRYTSCLPVDAIPTRSTKAAESAIVPGAISDSSSSVTVVPASSSSSSAPSRPIDVFIVWSFDCAEDRKDYLLPLLYCLGELKLSVHHESRVCASGSPVRARELAVAMRAPFVIVLFTGPLLDSTHMDVRTHSIDTLRIVKYRAEQAQLQQQRIKAGQQTEDDQRFDFQPCALLPIFIPSHDSESVAAFLNDSKLEFDPASPFLKAIEVGADPSEPEPASLAPGLLPTLRCAEWEHALFTLQCTLKSFLPVALPNPLCIDPAVLSPPQLAQYKLIRSTKDWKLRTAAKTALNAGENEKQIERAKEMILRTILQMERFKHPTAVVLPAPSIKQTPKGLIATLESLADSVSLRSLMCTEVQVRLLCECSADPSLWHYADGDDAWGGYRVHRPNAFIQRHGKTLKVGLQILAAAARFVPFVGSAVGEAAKGSADTIRAIADDAAKVSDGLSSLIGCVDTLISEAGGSGASGLAQSNKDHVAATTFGEWLDAQDRKEKRTVFHCGLQRVVLLRDESYSTLDGEELRERKCGSVVWLCEKHTAEYREQRWGRPESDERKTTRVESEATAAPASADAATAAAPASAASSSSPSPLRNNFVAPASSAAPANSPGDTVAVSGTNATAGDARTKKADASGCCTVQ